MRDSKGTVAAYDTHAQAEAAIKELQRSGFDMTRLSIVGKGYRTEEHPTGFYSTWDRMKVWGGYGAFWGAIWGGLVGAVFLWIPGFGPIEPAGPLIHALAAAGEGAVLIGGIAMLGAALVSLGMPRNATVKYETEVRAERYLVVVHGDSESVAEARSLLGDHDGGHGAAYAA